MLKKILLLIGIYFLFNVNVQAKELPTFKVGSSTAYKGEVVTIPITLENNPGFGYIGVKIRYDTERLECVDSYLVSKFTGATFKGIEVNAKKTITLYALTSEEDLLLKDNGKIAEIKFKVLSDSLEDIKVEATVDNFGKGKDEDIEINKIDGIIHIATHGTVGKKENLFSEIEDIIDKTLTDEKILWKSSNEDVASVSEDGNVTFKKNGTAKIEAIDEDGNVIYSKNFKVDKKVSNKSRNFYILGSIILIFLIILFLVRKFYRRKNK